MGLNAVSPLGGRGPKSESGIAGFFEDIPTLIIITVSLSIFLLSIAQSFASYSRFQDISRFEQECMELSEKVRAYDGLVYDKWMVPGVFDKSKMENLTPEKVSEDLYIRWDYQIEIIDVTGYYEFSYNLTINSTPMPTVPGVDYTTKQSIYSSVNIWVQEDEVHAGHMIVSIWK